MNIKVKHKIMNKGFTLIEILVVIGIIGVLATVVLVAVNPARQFKQARDSQRVANVNTILNALGQNISDHQGVLHCGGGPLGIPNSPVLMATEQDGLDIADCLIPEYLPKLPHDPYPERGHYTTEDDYNTGYFISSDPLGRLTIAATGEIQENISVSR